MILTTYFTRKPDWQRKKKFSKDDASNLLMAKTAIKVKAPHIIFYDELSDDFVQAHTNEYTEFVKVSNERDSLDNNDYRFFVYRDWLETHFYDFVWCVDLFDVRFFQNPNKLYVDAPFTELDSDIWCGCFRDVLIGDRTILGQAWMLHGSGVPYSENVVHPTAYGQPLTMAGTWGGRYYAVRKALLLLTTECQRMRSSFNAPAYNMPAFNTIVYRDLVPVKILSPGWPLHSVFGLHETDHSVVLAHK